MGVSGFPIKAEDSATNFDQRQPWLWGGILGTFNAVNDKNGVAEFEINSFGAGDINSFVIGQSFFVNSTGAAGDYEEVYGIITDIDYDTEAVKTTIPFVMGSETDTGGWVYGENCTFENDTPDNFLREIHVQFDVNTAIIIEVTFDGVNFMSLNNNDTIIGLQTFTLFVTKFTKLNFNSNTAGPIDFTITVTAA